MRLIDADAYIKYINTALNDALNGATTPSGIISCMAIAKGIEDDMRNEKITPTIEPDHIWNELSKVYNMDSVPDEAKSIIGDVMLGLGEQPEPYREEGGNK